MVIGAVAVDVMGVPSVAETTAEPDAVRLMEGLGVGVACAVVAATVDTDPTVNAAVTTNR